MDDALDGGYAVGYFEPWDQYSMEAVIRTAEKLRSPVIIGCGGIMMNQEWFDEGGLEGLGRVGRALAERSMVPTALILNEVLTFDQVVRGLEYGFNAVMLDTSALSFEDNIRITRKVAEAAHEAGAHAEAELGHLPVGTGEDEQEPALTDPDQAAEFVAATGIDALGVSIGNIHIMLHGKSENIDLDRLEQIHRKVDVPLVIHGSTGFPDTMVPRAIELGVAKFNVGTALKKAFWEGLREAVDQTPAGENPQHIIGTRDGHDIVQYAADFMQREVQRLIRLYMAATQI
jgi:fructose-bisphosphate aldolase class II